MFGRELYSDIHDGNYEEEPQLIRATQCHSVQNFEISTLRHSKFETGYASYLYHVGCSRNEDSIKSGRVVLGGFSEKKGRNAVYFSLVSPLDKDHHSQVQAVTHVKRHHDLVYVVDLDRTKHSLDVFKPANASVQLYETVPSEFTTEIIMLQGGTSKYSREPTKADL